MIVTSQSYIFDQRPAYPLCLAAKRYWDPQSLYLDDPSAITLIFTHGAGFHKEIWEPVIDELYYGGWKGVKIREMWSIEAPNHGDAFIMNEQILKTYRPMFIWEEYGRTVHAFLSGLVRGLDIDFNKRRLVGVGSCMGAICLLLSLHHAPSINFESLILSELVTTDNKTLVTKTGPLTEEAAKRRDIWPSREAAYNDLKSQFPWKAWDDRVLRIYVDGIRPLPTPHYTDKTGVTLKCPRVQEISCYADLVGLRHVYESLGTIAEQLPIHVIYGADKEYTSKHGKDGEVECVLDALYNVVSFSRLEGVQGRHISQVNPKGFAQKIYEALPHSKFKL